MKLDVVLPTYNRSGLLSLAIASLFAAPRPDGLDVSVIVVDNNSKDDTAEVVRRLQAEAPIPLHYVRETKQGLSNARNGGIAAGSGELIGFIDDDEQIAPEWFAVIAREFADPATQFIGGPYLADCAVPLPSWLPPGYNGILGIIPPKPRTRMAPPFPGNLQGGNAVFRRSVFDRVGLYNPTLGRSGKGLLSEEDAELYRRLLDANLLGFHVPDLAIFHHIPPDRLTRSYHRRWCFWRGVSHGMADRERQEPVAYLFGVPRYRLGQAARGFIAFLRNVLLRGNSGPSFARELPLWDLLGFVRGKFFTRAATLYGAKG